MKKIITTILVFNIFACHPPPKNTQEHFALEVEDVFSLTGGKTVIVGQVKSGEIRTSEKLIVNIDGTKKIVIIEEMEIFAKPNQHDVIYKNDYAGLHVSGLSKSQLKKGMILLKDEN